MINQISTNYDEAKKYVANFSVLVSFQIRLQKLKNSVTFSS